MNNQQKDLHKTESHKLEGRNLNEYDNDVEDKLEDDNWENYSDYDSNEEQIYQGEKIKKEQIASIMGNKTKITTNTSDRKRTYDSARNPKHGYADTNDRKVYGGKFEKREKFGKFDNYNTYDKSDGQRGYDKLQKYDKYDKYEKYDNYEHYNNYDNYEKYDHYENYAHYDKYEQSQPYSHIDKNEKYQNYNRKYNGNEDNYYQSRTYHKYDENYNDYKNTNNSYAYKKNNYASQQGNISTPINKNKSEDGYEDHNYYNKFENKSKTGYKKQEGYNTAYNKYYKKSDHVEESHTPSPLNNSIIKTNPSYSYKSDDKEKFINSNTDVVYNTNNNYARKISEYNKDGDRNKEKSYELRKYSGYKKNQDSGYKNNPYQPNTWKEKNSQGDNNYYKKEGSGSFKHDSKKNSEDSNFDLIKKPVFINSNLVKDNESNKTQTENESTAPKLPITGLLNVPLHKINEKIINSKENYVQSQLQLQNLNDNHKSEVEENKINKEKGKTADKEKKNSVCIENNIEKKQNDPNVPNQQATHENYKNPNFNFNHTYQNAQNYSTPNQNNNYHNQNQNVNYLTNMQNIPNVNNYCANMNTNNLNIPANANPQYNITNSFQNPLTNYYANANYNVMQNYYSKLNTYQSEIHETPSEDINLKQFTDKLNLNAKVFVPKKHVENKFDNCQMVYPESMKQYYTSSNKMQAQNFVSYDNKFS